MISAALIPTETVTRFLGRNSSKAVSYPAAAAAGSLLAVCSCTIVPLFAGIYHWFPKVTGRRLNERLGLVHFAGSFVCMNVVIRLLHLSGQRYAGGAGQANTTDSASCSATG